MASHQNHEVLEDQIIKIIIDIFVRTIGFIEHNQISRATNPAKDLYVDTDDLTIFIAEIEKHFRIDPSPEEWLKIDGSFESVAQLILIHQSR